MFFKSTTSIPYRNLKMKKTLNMSSPSPFFLPVSHRLLPQSRGSLKVNPPQELSLPMLVRKSALKEKTASSLPPKKTKTIKPTNQPKDGQADGRTPGLQRFLLPLFLSLIIFFPLSAFPVCSCSVCVTERKLSSLPPSFPPSSYSLGVVIPLLLSSALAFERRARQPCSLQNTRSVPQCFHTFHRRGGVCVRERRGDTHYNPTPLPKK